MTAQDRRDAATWLNATICDWMEIDFDPTRWPKVIPAIEAAFRQQRIDALTEARNIAESWSSQLVAEELRAAIERLREEEK